MWLTRHSLPNEQPLRTPWRTTGYGDFEGHKPATHQGFPSFLCGLKLCRRTFDKVGANAKHQRKISTWTRVSCLNWDSAMAKSLPALTHCSEFSEPFVVFLFWSVLHPCWELQERQEEVSNSGTCVACAGFRLFSSGDSSNSQYLSFVSHFYNFYARGIPSSHEDGTISMVLFCMCTWVDHCFSWGGGAK